MCVFHKQYKLATILNRQNQSFLIEELENLEVCRVLLLLIFGSVVDPILSYTSASAL